MHQTTELWRPVSTDTFTTQLLLLRFRDHWRRGGRKNETEEQGDCYEVMFSINVGSYTHEVPPK